MNGQNANRLIGMIADHLTPKFDEGGGIHIK